MLIKFEVNMKLSVICLLCLLSERLEQVLDAVRGECRLTKDTHDFKDGPTNLEVVLDDGNEAVCDDGNVNLMRTVFSDSPQKRLTWRCCLIHLKKSSTCHLYL